MISRRLFMGLAAALPFVGKAAAEPAPILGAGNRAEGFQALTGVGESARAARTTGSNNTFIGHHRIMLGGHEYRIKVYDTKG